MKPNIVFIGGTPRGLELIRQLVKKKEKVARAVIMPEAKHEPLKVSKEIEKICRVNKIPSTVSNVIEVKDIPALLNLKPDVVFVSGWRTIIPAQFYKNIPQGCLAAHDSLLPKYRGFAPTAWAIINGEKRTGVTLFKIDEQGVDAGDIFGQKIVKIGRKDTAEDIYPHIVKASVTLYMDFLKALKKGNVRWRKQEHFLATYASKRTPEDGRIDWDRPANEVFNFIRALTPPYPYSWTLIGGEKIFIKNVVLPKKQLKYPRGIAGYVSEVSREGVLVLCKVGQILLKEVITGSGEVLDANKYVKSVTTILGKY